MRTLFHPTEEQIKLTGIFYALSDPIRLSLVKSLADGAERSCGGFGPDIPKSTMSHHFKVLRESGVVRTRIEGTQRYMKLRAEELERRFPGLLAAVQASEQPF